MRRRQFIKVLAGSAAAWPLAARAQQSARKARLAVIGTALDNPVSAPGYRAFYDELRQLGFREGENLSVDFRSLDEDPNGAAAWVNERIRSGVDAFVTVGPEIALKVVHDASQTIPIVMQATNFDPIARGYIASLARPGGNVTGVFVRQTDLAGKQVELLSESFPNLTRLAVLWDALSADQFENAASVARMLRLDVLSSKLENPPYDFGAAFKALATRTPQMLLVISSPFFTPSAARIADLAVAQRLPSMFTFKAYVEAGGLMAYTTDTTASYRRMALAVTKILNGVWAADIPVEQPTKFALIINLRTAKALDVTIPPSVVARADEVIE